MQCSRQALILRFRKRLIHELGSVAAYPAHQLGETEISGLGGCDFDEIRKSVDANTPRAVFLATSVLSNVRQVR